MFLPLGHKPLEIMKKQVYDLLNKNRTFIQLINGLIVLNIFALFLESYEEVRDNYGGLLNGIEIVSVLIFTVEYLLRLWTADLNKNYQGSNWSKRRQFSTSTFGVIDLLAILPFYLPFIFPFDLRVVRILRLFRLLRVLKLGRFSKSLRLMRNVLIETRSEMVVTLFMAFIMLVLSSTLMYYVEHDAQPEDFKTIGHSFWWAIATLTTVGYGDIYPITAMGRILGGIIALIGIGIIALPTGIVSSAFIDQIQQKKKKPTVVNCECPNCKTKFTIKLSGDQDDQ